MDSEAIGYKLGRIFLPIFLLAIVFVAIYSVANWFLFSDSGLAPLDQSLANTWLPIGLGLLLAAVLVTPRLSVLKLGSRASTYYWMAAAAVLILPACLAQQYVTTASGRLTAVKSASDIPLAPRTKYYTVSDTCIDRSKQLLERENYAEGKSNQYLVFNLYVLVPVCGTAPSPAWIGLKYTDSTDNRESEAAKESEYRDFLKNSQEKFDAFDPARIQYLESLGRNSDRRSYEKAFLKVGGARKSPPTILIPHENAFEARNGQALSNTFWSFGIIAGIFLVMLLFPDVDDAKIAEAQKPRSERAVGEANAWLAIIVPRRDAYGLPFLIDVNLAVFLAMVFSGLGVLSFQADDLLRWGANYGPAIHGLSAYRLISSQFVHTGLMHLASNMYGLLVGGLFLSPVIRKAGLILCYLVCGLAGAIASVVTHPSIMGVGASGAIMGLWGILLALALLGDKRIAAGRWPVVLNCMIFAGLTLAQGALNPAIDNAAHIGGLATGMVIGTLMFWFSWGEKLQASPAKPQLSVSSAGGDGGSRDPARI